MKLVEKWAELEQLMLKFVSRSRVRIFRNERTLSTPIGLETLVLLHFIVFGVHLGPFCYCMKLDAKWPKLVQLMQKFVPQRRVRIFRNERTRSNP